MKYGYKEVISDSEAQRFARNLCKKKRERFPTFDDAMSFVFKIRKVVSDKARLIALHRYAAKSRSARQRHGHVWWPNRAINCDLEEP